MSKRGKNYLNIGGVESKESQSSKLILDLMICCDGLLDIIDIANLLDQYAFELIPTFQSLEAEGLIEKSK